MIHRRRSGVPSARRKATAAAALIAVTLPALMLVATSAEAGPSSQDRGRPATPEQSTPRLAPPLVAAFNYQPPLRGLLSVVGAFVPPPDRYSAGHRGVDLLLAQDRPVLAAGAGTVTFVGSVAGRPVLVIAHPDGISTEYEPVVATVRAGQHVVGGQVIGRLKGDHARCAPLSCLHWGARRADTYIDPMGLLDQLGVVRLVA